MTREEAKISALQTYVRLRTSEGAGSGFVVAIEQDTVIVATANHVVDPASISGNAKTISPTFYPIELRAPVVGSSCEIIATESSSDLAFLRCRCAGPECIEQLRSASMARVGVLEDDDLNVPLTLIGGELQPFPFAENNTLTDQGAPKTQTTEGKPIYFTSPICEPGFSGGPLLDDDWNVIGMVTGSHPDESSKIFLALRIDDLIAFAEAHGVPMQLTRGERRPRLQQDRFKAISLEVGASALRYESTVSRQGDWTGPAGVVVLHAQWELIPFSASRFAVFLKGGVGYQLLRSVQLLRSPVGPVVNEREFFEHGFAIEAFLGLRLFRTSFARPEVQVGGRVLFTSSPPQWKSSPRWSFPLWLGLSHVSQAGRGARWGISGGLELALEESPRIELAYTGDGASLTPLFTPWLFRLGVRVGVPLWF